MPIYYVAPSKFQPCESFQPDSAGIIYPYVAKKNWNSVYRYEAELDEPVSLPVLEMSVDDMRERFPMFFVQVIEKDRQLKMYCSKRRDVICEEDKDLCKPFDMTYGSKPLIRITYSGYRLGVEIFHEISDGHGTLTFFKALLARYFTLMGEYVPYNKGVIGCDTTPSPEETEDAFIKIYEQGGKSVNRLMTTAWQYGLNSPQTPLTVSDIIVSEESLHAAAKERNTTVGVILTSVYLYSLIKSAETKPRKDIRISVPVDLRRFFPSKTLRNFSLYILVGINPGEKDRTLEDIIETVKKQFEEKINTKLFSDMAYTNVASTKSLAFRIAPLAIKRAVLNFGFDYLGERQFSSTLTNIGRIDIPAELAAHVMSIRMILGETKLTRINSSAYSFSGQAHITISAMIDSKAMVSAFAGELNTLGLHAVIKTRNYETGNYEFESGDGANTTIIRGTHGKRLAVSM